MKLQPREVFYPCCNYSTTWVTRFVVAIFTCIESPQVYTWIQLHDYFHLCNIECLYLLTDSETHPWGKQPANFTKVTRPFSPLTLRPREQFNTHGWLTSASANSNLAFVPTPSRAAVIGWLVRIVFIDSRSLTSSPANKTCFYSSETTEQVTVQESPKAMVNTYKYPGRSSVVIKFISRASTEQHLTSQISTDFRHTQELFLRKFFA